MKFRESWSHLGAMWCVFREAKEDDNRSYKYDERADCEECRERQIFIQSSKHDRGDGKCGSGYGRDERGDIKLTIEMM